MTDDLAAELARALGSDVEDLRRLSAGASRETWAFDAVDGHVRRPLVLQRRPVGASGRLGIGAQAELMRAARAAAVPVPEVVYADSELAVIERVDGETIPRKILRDETYASARSMLASQCGQALARIHSVALEGLPPLDERDPLKTYRDLLDSMDEAHPALELGFRWLEPRRPPPGAPALVHGDFRMGNFIVGPEGLRAVIDWELAHLGDPMEDLGWMLVKSWRFGSALPVGGVGTREDFFDAYARGSGRAVDPEVVRWWEVFGTVRWGVICMLQARIHLSGAERSVELAAIGRRVCEVEHDLMLLLP